MSRENKSATAGYTVGKYKPPKEYRFKKGEPSPNRFGRGGKPKAEPTQYLTDLPSHRTFLEEAQRMIRVNSGDSSEELPTAQVVMRSLAMDAMKPGHPYATREYLKLLRESEAAEFEKRRKVFDYWRGYADKAKAVIEKAREASEDEPRLLPHPDDIRFDFSELTVRFVGPLTDEEADRIEKLCRIKLLLLEAAGFDAPDVENDPDVPLGQRQIGLWMVQYILIDLSLPPRLSGISEEDSHDITSRTWMPDWRRRAQLEERFEAEGLKFVMLGGKQPVFKMDDLADQAGVAEQWRTVIVNLQTD